MRHYRRCFPRDRMERWSEAGVVRRSRPLDVPAGEAEGGVIGHEIDLELVAALPADHLLAGGLHEFPLSELLLEMGPYRPSREVDDEIDVIRRAHALPYSL